METGRQMVGGKEQRNEGQTALKSALYKFFSALLFTILVENLAFLVRGTPLRQKYPFMQMMWY